MASLDPFIRIQIQKRGITFIANTYTGFDTEFTLLKGEKHLNKLVSVQKAVQSRVFVKMPLYSSYDISYIHPLTSEITAYYKPKDPFIGRKIEGEGVEERGISELGLINESIKSCIYSIRQSKYTTLDEINRQLIVKFKEVPSVRYFEDYAKDSIIFALPITNINTSISYPKSYSLNELILKSNSMAHKDIENSFNIVLDKFNELPLSGEINRIKTWFVNSNKPRSRTNVSFQSGDKVSLTVVRNNYIIAHYNPADLSILEDFPSFKQELQDLGIVNKSFFTLSKPIIVANTNVYFRDTHLLTPAAGKGLVALGKLYSEDLNSIKVEISNEDKEHMDEYLLREPLAFAEYAIRDAIIPLKHAVTLENVNFDIKRIGVPITLSSLGRALVLER